MATAEAAANAAQLAASGISANQKDSQGGRFDFDDGGTYCGGWEEGKAHGHGVCTGPKGQGEYRGSWHYGFEVSGVYTWPSGSYFEGHWQNGKRHGLGVESRGRWLYRGEWTQGFKGRYGVRQACVSNAKYEGTWANGLQDGYGSETYADGGTFQGQWLRGLRHGYGVRTSAPFGMASHNKLSETRMASMTSLHKEEEAAVAAAQAAAEALEEAETGATDPAAAAAVERARTISRRGEEARGGFVLRAKSDEYPARRRSLVERTGMKTLVQGLKLKKQRSTGDLDRKGVTSIRSTGSSTSWMSSESGFTTGASMMSEGSNQSFVLEDEQLDASVTETYMGEWKNDKRCGFGISERSDGLKYEGEWYNNRKYGYGVTTHRGVREEGKYKNNVLVTSNQKRHLFLMRSAKFRERIDSALNAAQRASKIALQKADIAISRTATARGKAEQADIAAVHAREDAQLAIGVSKQFGAADEINATSDQKPTENLLTVKNHNNAKANAAISPPQTNRPRTPEVVIHAAPMEKKGLQTKATPMATPSVPSQPSAQKPPSFQPPAQPPTRQPQPVAAPAQPAPLQPPGPRAPPPQNNVMKPNPPQPQPPQFVRPAAAVLGHTGGGAMTTPSTTNCDISNTTDNTAMFQMPNHQPLRPAQPARGRSPRTEQPQQPMQPMFQDTNNVGRSPMASARAPAQAYGDTDIRGRRGGAVDGGGAVGGYNFQRIMDDRFEHYKRPPSRERSVDPKIGLPTALSEASASAAATVTGSATVKPRGRSGSRPPLNNTSHPTQPQTSSSRAPSRNRTPLPLGTSATDMDLDLRRKELEAKMASAAASQNGEAAHEEDPGLRFRGQPSQEIANLGTIPKRTESLYLKQSLDPKGKDTPAGTLQRKKSLPDVQCLDVTTKAQGSKAMTREEISVLSSARREAVRKQLEEIERYKSNPFLYILNPRVREWISRQKLMLLILFINLSLAIMFFKLLT